jgi:hypothetical protein
MRERCKNHNALKHDFCLVVDVYPVLFGNWICEFNPGLGGSEYKKVMNV